MDDHRKLRASDDDRQEVVERLRAAMEDGRVTMDEYLDRMGLAYQAVTYGDLAVLHGDLPEAGSMAKREATPTAAVLPEVAAPVAARDPGPVGVLADMPVTLKVLWTIWLTAVLINVVVWALVSSTTGSLIYPWPVWVAGPSGAALFAVSAGATQIRHSRRSRAGRRSAGRD